MKTSTTFLLCLLSVNLLWSKAKSIVIDTVPQTQNIGLVSTSWDDFKTASPGENIPEIELLSPTSSGDANLSFPINIPEARNGLQPNITVNYANEGGQTWLGTGWDLSFSTFSLDTRWGVPTYFADMETEIYLLDGEQLGPVFHRAQIYEREAEREFFKRQEEDFHKIIRHGNSPSNYWWEVTETNGTVHYYGGNPSAGLSSAHILTTEDGEIVEWKISETHDKYQNFIQYSYQKINDHGGTNMYPREISYNGHLNQPGPYRIQFNLRSKSGDNKRTDVSTSGRTGAKLVIADLLEEIIVEYQNQIIRSYQFDYLKGAFDKTLLERITEYDQNGDEFYDFDFEYHNDIQVGNSYVSYTAAKDWDVPSDNIPLASIIGEVEGFNSKPTILGGSHSVSTGAGLAITVGPPFNPITKDYSAGPNSSITNTNSTGLTALIDINGDGLPDKLWKEDDGLYFRPNLHKGQNPVEGFGIRTKINGLKEFSKANTFAWTLGVEVNLAPTFFGYFHEESTTNVTTYFADFNGDELMDIAHDGEVYFNHIDNSGVPTFTLFSGDTPSVIYKGEDQEEDEISPAEQAEIARRNPLHDVVRVWKAPFTGNINIQSEVSLIENTSQEAVNYSLKDGVNCFIQYESFNVLIQRIEADDFTSKEMNAASLSVEQGDKIYFRVNSVYDGLYDEVEWDPIISYLNEDQTDINADCIPQHRYQASEDFLISEVVETYIPADGRIVIKGELDKPVLTDTIRLEISGTIDTSIVFTPGTEFNGEILFNEYQVLSGDKLSFSISAQSNVDWPRLSWRPIIEYVAFDNGTDPIGPDGKPLISICPKVEIKGYLQQLMIPELYVAQEDGLLRYTANLTAGFNNVGIFNISMKTKGKVDSVQYSINTANVNDTYMCVIEKEVSAGDSIYFELNYDFLTYFQIYNIDASTVSLNGSNPSPIQSGHAVKVSNDTPEEGHYYRGWGQFVYNAHGDFPTFPMNVQDLAIDTTGIAGDTSLVDEGSSTGDLEGSMVSSETKFIVMTSGPKTLAWHGSDDLTYLTGTRIGSTRYGRKNIDPANNSTNLGASLKAPKLITRTRGDAGLGGVGVGPLEGSLGGAVVVTWSDKDIGDMNGDRYPDHIDVNKIRYTNFRGEITSLIHPHLFGTHEVLSLGVVGGLGRNYPNSGARNAGASKGKGSSRSATRVRSKGKASMGKSKGAFNSAQRSVGINGSIGGDFDSAKHTFIDINGDGLEDKIWDDGRVALSLGYSFAPVENWGFENISGGDSFDAGAGLGVSISNGSIQAGGSVSRTSNRSTYGFLDLNDDALIDQIVSTNPIMVRINTGTGFTNPILWMDEEKFDDAVSIGESLNAAFTICAEFLFFRVCFNPSVYHGQGSSGIHSSFQDIDGDGYPDFLEADKNDANLRVSSSKIGQTNFLKKINHAMVGSSEFEYDYVGNTYGIPFSKWVLSSSTVYDGVEEDGVNELTRTFEYKNGRYDRHDRQFYGFGEVRDKYYSAGEVAREVVSEYRVDSYYTKGLNKKQSLLDGNGNIYKEISQEFFLKDIETGAILPDNFLQVDDGMASPILAQKQTTYYEGGLQGLSNTLIYSYDTLNVIASIIDIDEVGSVKNISYEYDHDFDNYFLDRKIKETITSNGQLLRESEFELDGLGNQLLIRRRIDQDNWAVTDFSYDSFGNVLSMTRPANHKGERLNYNNIYDSENSQYLISELDGYGYQMDYEYEPLFNQLIRSTDINGNETLYDYDSKGRSSSILYPYEAADNIEYSVKFEYYPEATVPYAIVKHYDIAHQSDLEVYYFEDGLERNIQTKIRTDISDYNGNSSTKFIVSGIDKYDALGRVMESYLPTEESPVSVTTFKTTADSADPIVSAYDPLDRPIYEIDTYGARTTFEYSIGEDNLGRKLLQVNTTDPYETTRTSLFNTRGDLNATRYNGNGNDIWTNYIYDDISQVTSVIDAYGNETFYTYDLLGRRTSVKVPDAGLTELRYDAADNLTERVTATIRDVISADGSIRYSYDHERLIQIDYPKHFENKVQIHYGMPQDSFNRAGRIWLQEDASGGREYFFDINGNPTKTIRTVMINRSQVYTYVSENEYDGWGRIKTMSYPDGEKVMYNYNRGALLESLSGERSGVEYQYISFAGYDKFKDRIYTEYGNLAIDHYRYDDKGRLENRKLFSSSGNLLSDEDYGYDLADNLISKINNASGSDQMGGRTTENYSYDQLFRMTTASGTWEREDRHSYEMFFDYDDLNNLTMKSQIHAINDSQEALTSRIIDYQYESEGQPTRPTEVGGKDYYYDLNGNLLLRNSFSVFDYDQNIFDEENRLLGSSDNGYISRYSYDAFGRRTLKSHGEFQGVFINGAPAGFVEHKTNYTIQVSPYFTVNETEYRKHYYLDNTRILSKIGTGLFQTSLGNGPELTAGGIDYKYRIQQYESSILDYYSSLGVPPGPPGLLAHLGQPELNETSLPDATSTNPYNLPPNDWPNISPPDTLGPPGTPVFYEFADINNENVSAGYNFTDGNITAELESFFYHYDYHNSSQYVTDYAGNPRQYATYFPSGERWVYQWSSFDESRHFYGGRVLDQETGFYNMGDIYYDPVTNIEMSVDPVLQNFGQQTFLRRPEGSFYYEYADEGSTETAFDNEILNSERPDPFLGNAVNTISQNRPDEKKVVRVGPFLTKKQKKEQERKKKQKIANQKKAVVAELAELTKAFQDQDSESATEFYYGDFNSFQKAKQEEKRYKRRQQIAKQKRTAKSKKNKRKKLAVRFK